jgi:hypothetical protein
LAYDGGPDSAEGAMKLLKSTSIVMAFAAVACSSIAQEKKDEKKAEAPAAQESVNRPSPNPKDVASLDAIVAAVYEVISGPAGDRDWNRFRSLFTAEGRLVPIFKKPDGTFGHRVLTVEDYVKNGSDYFKKEAFYEREIARRTEQFGQMAVIFTTYASRHTPDEKPFARGINSMTFYNDGSRWWCLSIIWDSERPDNPIPDKYLK